jgi:hypothetical protein
MESINIENNLNILKGYITTVSNEKRVIMN